MRASAGTGGGAHKGRLVIICGPSGVGKTSIVKRLLEKPGRKLSVSATTRPRRKGEQDGVDYFFVSPGKFETLVQQGWFAEHATVHGHHYGTPLGPLEEAMEAGIDFFLDVDVQGAERLKKRFPHAISVFILPPSEQVLAARLRGRGTDAAEDIERRLENARNEIAHKNQFDYCVVNDKLDDAVLRIEEILSTHE